MLGSITQGSLKAKKELAKVIEEYGIQRDVHVALCLQISRAQLQATTGINKVELNNALEALAEQELIAWSERATKARL